MKNGLILLSLCILSACGTPNGETTIPPTPQATPQSSPQEIPVSPTIGKVPADSQGQFTMDLLSREQYVNAMACAAEKAAPGSKFRFKSQWSAYQSPLSEDSYNNAIAVGGDGQFILYTQAISLGCPG